MPIDPALQPLLGTFEYPPAEIVDPDAFRAAMNKGNDDGFESFGNPGPSVAEHRVIHVPSTGGSVRADLFRPHTPGPHPVHLFLHGGGWVMNTGYSKDSEAISRTRSIEADCVVISIDYRKAPEHPFPIPVHDAIAVVDWVRAHAVELGAIPGALTIGGQSSGGNIAAAATLVLRDQNRTDIAFQLLEVPALDLSHQILRVPGDSWPLRMIDVRMLSRQYLAGGDATNPLASPLLAPDLTGLPGAYIAVAEYDVLRPDGEQYAQRLREAGVPVQLYIGKGHVHMSPTMTKLLASARSWQASALAALSAANTALRSASLPTRSFA